RPHLKTDQPFRTRIARFSRTMPPVFSERRTKGAAMQWTLITASALALCSHLVQSACAGIYNSQTEAKLPNPANEEREVQALPFSQFHTLLIDLYKIPIDRPESPQRTAALEAVH